MNLKVKIAARALHEIYGVEIKTAIKHAQIAYNVYNSINAYNINERTNVALAAFDIAELNPSHQGRFESMRAAILTIDNL